MRLSAVITAHDEGEMLVSAVVSVCRAYESARLGLRWHSASSSSTGLELILVLDRSDERTRDVANRISSQYRSTDRDIQTVVSESDFGEPGSARNHGVRLASGDVVLILDGDDLAGRLFVSRAIHLLAEDKSTSEVDGGNLVLHPEFLFYFGTKTILWRQPTYAEYLKYPQALLRNNLWDVTMITTRQLLLTHPFQPSDARLGSGYEDWEWSLSSSRKGIRHDSIAGSFCYKRAKRVSRFSNDNVNSVLVETERMSKDFGFYWRT